MPHKGAPTMKNRMSTLMAGLALLCLGYSAGRFRDDTNIAHADETPKWTKIEFPLGVFHRESTANHAEYAWSEGFWQSDSSYKDRQVGQPLSVFIMCRQNTMICQESIAFVSPAGLLRPGLQEYDITSWTSDSIVAEQRELCGVGFRLSLDFNRNTVTRISHPREFGPRPRWTLRDLSKTQWLLATRWGPSSTSFGYMGPVFATSRK